MKKGGSATAYYGWYKVFDTPFSYEAIGGDPRANIQHSMNPIPEDREEFVLDILLGEAELDSVIKAKESNLEYKLTGKKSVRKIGETKMKVTPQNGTVEHLVQAAKEIHTALQSLSPHYDWKFGKVLEKDITSYRKT